jgi:hypothetical protein
MSWLDGAPPVRGYLICTLLENVSGARVTGIAAAAIEAIKECRWQPAR